MLSGNARPLASSKHRRSRRDVSGQAAASGELMRASASVSDRLRLKTISIALPEGFDLDESEVVAGPLFLSGPVVLREKPCRDWRVASGGVPMTKEIPKTGCRILPVGGTLR